MSQPTFPSTDEQLTELILDYYPKPPPFVGNTGEQCQHSREQFSLGTRHARPDLYYYAIAGKNPRPFCIRLAAFAHGILMRYLNPKPSCAYDVVCTLLRRAGFSLRAGLEQDDLPLIAGFYASAPDPQSGSDELANYLKEHWEPPVPAEACTAEAVQPAASNVGG